MDQPFGFGADHSPKDYRTITHDASTLASPFLVGGYDYAPSDIEYQRKVGICTSAWMVMNAQRVFQKKFSIDFQYLLQKKFIDKNWDEGSSLFASLKVGKNYGFLPKELFTWVTEADRDLPYAQYVTKLQSVPDTVIQDLLTHCTDRLSGYAQIDISTPEALAKAIDASKAGIGMRFAVGKEWYTPSWKSIDIDPLKPPQIVISGHAINGSKYDFTWMHKFYHPNSWSLDWDLLGVGTTIWEEYKPTEAWIPYYDFIPERFVLPAPGTFKHIFVTPMSQSPQYNAEVKNLQIALMMLGYLPLLNKEDMGYYGKRTSAAVLAFQVEKVALTWYERYVLAGSKVGQKTLTALNTIYGIS